MSRAGQGGGARCKKWTRGAGGEEGGVVEKRRDDTVCAALASVNVTVLLCCASRMQVVLLSAGPTQHQIDSMFANSHGFCCAFSGDPGPRMAVTTKAAAG